LDLRGPRRCGPRAGVLAGWPHPGLGCAGQEPPPLGRGQRQRVKDPRASSVDFQRDRKSTRLNSSHLVISYAVFCLKKKKYKKHTITTTSKTTNRRSTTSTRISAEIKARTILRTATT